MDLFTLRFIATDQWLVSIDVYTTQNMNLPESNTMGKNSRLSSVSRPRTHTSPTDNAIPLSNCAVQLSC